MLRAKLSNRCCLQYNYSNRGLYPRFDASTSRSISSAAFFPDCIAPLMLPEGTCQWPHWKRPGRAVLSLLSRDIPSTVGSQPRRAPFQLPV